MADLEANLLKALNIPVEDPTGSSSIYGSNEPRATKKPGQGRVAGSKSNSRTRDSGAAAGNKAAAAR